MTSQTAIFTKTQLIDEKYAVSFFLKKGTYAESYRVQNEAGQTKFLKLFDYNKLHRTQFTDQGDILEIDILKHCNHPNLVKYYDSGHFTIDNYKLGYVVVDFVSGETIANRMKRDHTIRPYEAKDIIIGVLNGLYYLHSQQIIHNDLTIQNIMLDLSGNIAVPRIFDLGHARFAQQSHKDFLKEDINLFYTANETFNKVFSIQSDIFAVGALYYHMITGLPPYFVEIPKFREDSIALENAILEERRKKLPFPDKTDPLTQRIILKALQAQAENRFSSVKEFLQALNGEITIEVSSVSTLPPPPEKKDGKGFSAIAGMQELKDTIQVDVIDALRNKERYAEYGLTIPNGMLLYGPPGCGKTFFAEKMAEEIGFKFYQIKPSDIQSKWVNASQENIKNLFNEARLNAPSIIFIDELDALVPNRDAANINHMNTSAVNEFLAQMNNCGEDGVFLVGATNRPNAIDPAILRSGRLDKHVYLPPPDLAARQLMFELYLKNRPVELGMDYAEIARATDNYVSSDIKFLCDEASRKALRGNSRITKMIVLETIKNNKPSISERELNSYLAIKAKMEDRHHR